MTRQIRKPLISIVIMILLCNLVIAIDFNPMGDVNLKGRYALKNATWINGTNAYLTQNVTAANFIGNITGSVAWTSVLGRPTHLSNFTDNLGNRGYTHLSNFTNDGVFTTYLDFVWTNITGRPTHLSNFTNDLVTSGTFNASSITTARGTGSGVLSDVQVYDSITYNISEASGANPLNVFVNFTGVTTNLSSILLRERYEGGSGHAVDVYLWDIPLNAWESYHSMTDQDVLVVTSIPILDPNDHIAGGLVRMMFNHTNSGISSHELYIDYVALQWGTAAITANIHDSLSGRNSQSNHPWAMAKTAYTALSNFTDNLGSRGYTHLSNFTNNGVFTTYLDFVWANITGRPTYLSNFTDNLGNRGYSHLTNFTMTNLNLLGNNVSNISVVSYQNSSGVPVWRTYVNETGSLITEAI